MNATTPLISILIPVYNREQYLRKCLDSACFQTYTNIEIICVNDGSTDSSADILAEYEAKDSRIIVITQENQGLSGARNSGMKAVSGEWICGLDSDDWLELDALEKLVPLLDADIDCLLFERNYIWKNPEDDRKVKRIDFEGKYAITEELLMAGVNTNFHCKLWRTDFLRERGVSFLHGKLYEDVHFAFCTLPWTRNVYFTTQRLINIRRNHEDSIMMTTFTRNNERLLDCCDVYEAIFEYYQKQGYRQWRGTNSPTDLEMWMAQKCFIFINSFAPYGKLEEGWLQCRKLVDKYGLKERLPEYPILAKYYHLPPYVVKHMDTDTLQNRYERIFESLRKENTQQRSDIRILQSKQESLHKIANALSLDDKKQRSDIRVSARKLEQLKQELMGIREQFSLEISSAMEKCGALNRELCTLRRMLLLGFTVPSLRKQYRRLKCKELFSFGHRKNHYQKKLNNIKALLKEYQAMENEFNELKNNEKDI